jgi:tocopherol O-methyltransferase
MIVPNTRIVDVQLVADHYDELDPFYRAIWGLHLHHGYWATGRESTAQAVVDLVHLLAHEARIMCGTRVCDIGCGYGAADLILAREYGAAVTGITVSTKQFQIARTLRPARGELKFLLCNGLYNGLKAESFDCVIALESSEHIQDKPRFFTEAMRLLRSGGKLIAAAWLSRERPSRFETEYLLEPICVDSRLPSLASASEYYAMLTEAGFHNVVFNDLTLQVRKTWRVCALRFVAKLFSDPTLRERFFDPGFSNRVFAKALPRIWLAYKLGTMRYGLFSAQK